MHRFFICLIAAITIVIPAFSQNIVLHAPAISTDLCEGWNTNVSG